MEHDFYQEWSAGRCADDPPLRDLTDGVDVIDAILPAIRLIAQMNRIQARKFGLTSVAYAASPTDTVKGRVLV